MAIPKLLRVFALLCIFFFFFFFAFVHADSHFEGFDAEDDLDFEEDSSIDPTSLRPPPSQRLTTNPNTQPPPSADLPNSSPPPPPPTTTTTTFDFWDDDEFEGVPLDQANPTDLPSDPKSSPVDNNNTTAAAQNDDASQNAKASRSFTVEIICGSFLVIFGINYFTGKRENENIALSWATLFAAKDSIFEKNFSLLGIGDGGDDTPLLLKEGQTTFKFYASGRRYCQGLLATLELKSRHDLIARIYNLVVPTRDEITFEVYMNDDAMDHVVFAMARKKVAKAMQKDLRDLQRFANVLTPPTTRKWVADELAVVSESREVASDLITDAVIDQVFGEKAFEKFGKGLIAIHFSDNHPGIHKKVLSFKFVLPAATNMADMTRLVALVPYYIDLIGRYKLSSQARSKTETARQKAAQEAQKELRYAQQEAMQRKKAERKKMIEEAEAKLSAEAIKKKEAKDRARQVKKAMPRMKISRGA